MQKSYDPLDISVPKRSSDISNPNAEVVSAHKEGKTNELKTRNQSMKMPSVGKLGMKGDGRQF